MVLKMESRKHKLIANEKVSTKQSKRTKSDKVDRKTTGPQPADDNVVDESIVELCVEETVNSPQIETVEYSGKFSVYNFRRKIRENDFIQDARQFLATALKNPQVIRRYIESGGKPLELVEALDKLNQSDVTQIACLFHLIQLVLIEILSNSSKYTEGAVQTCRFLLKRHTKMFEKLIISPVAYHKRIALKLFTAIVALEPLLGRDILDAFDTTTHPLTLDSLTGVRKAALNRKDPETVRECYIHFVLAYLIEGNVQLIRAVMERSSLISAIMSNLVYDSPEIVCLVLNTLEEHIVNTFHISKTHKVYMFNVKIVANLMRLYDWQGPAGFLNKSTKDDDPITVDIDAKRAVRIRAHSFMRILLTSRKYGLAFQCLGQPYKKNVIHINTVQTIERPWACEELQELCVEILRACPELTGLLMKTISKSFKSPDDWLPGIQFVRTVVVKMEPWLIRYALAKMTIKDIAFNILHMTMPAPVLTSIQNCIRSEDAAIRLATIQAMSAMFEQCGAHVAQVMKCSHIKDFELKNFKYELTTHIFKYFPSIERILVALYTTIDAKESCMLEHLEATFDLLLFVMKSIPSFIDQTATVINYLNLLRPVYDTPLIDAATSTRIELKCIKLMLAIDPTSLTAETDLFGVLFTSFLKIYLNGSPEMRLEVEELLHGLLKTTGFFENGELEIDIWLHAFKTLKPEFVDGARDFIVQIIKELKKNPEEAFSSLLAAQLKIGNTGAINKTATMLFEQIEENIAAGSLMDVPTLGALLPTAIAAISAKSKDAPVKNYLEQVALDLFHFLPCAELVNVVCQEHALNVSDYFADWMAQRIGKIPNCIRAGIMTTLGESLIDGKQNFTTIFASGSPEDDAAVTSLIFFVIFMVVQLEKQSQMDEKRCGAAVHFVTLLLDILFDKKNTVVEDVIGLDSKEQKVTNWDRVVRYIFLGHSGLLQAFSVWDTKTRSEHLKYFVYEVIRHVKKQVGNFDALVTHYRRSVVTQIEVAIQSCSQSTKVVPKSTILIRMVDTIDLNAENCLSLINKIIELPRKYFKASATERWSIFGDVLVHCLKRLAAVRETVTTPPQIEKITRLYIDLATKLDPDESHEKFEESLLAYLSRYHAHLAQIEESLFHAICDKTKLSKAGVRLATLMVARINTLEDQAIMKIGEHIAKKELVYPLLNALFLKNVALSTDLLTKIYGEFKNGILKAIERPQKAGVIYRENVAASVRCIQLVMPEKDCVEFTQRTIKFETIEIFQVILLREIYRKALNTSVVAYTGLFGHLLNIFSILLKRTDTLDYEKINSVASITVEWARLRKDLPELKNLEFDSMTKAPSWQAFVKVALKTGMQSYTTEVRPEWDKKGADLLKLLAFVVENLFVDGCEAAEPKRIFDLATTHSQFFDLALDSIATVNKTQLFYLLSVCARKSPTILTEKHVPILLGSYSARLSIVDRYILSMIHLYEASGNSLYKYRPFVWGETAIAHYSLRNKVSEHEQTPLRLADVEIDLAQVLSLIEPEVVDLTLANYPNWRNLNTSDQMPEVFFATPASLFTHPDISPCKDAIERVGTTQSRRLLKFGPSREDTYTSCYDPAFMIPLMGMLFSPESIVQPYLSAENGSLSLVWAALSSCDLEMRVAAAHVLLRYRDHIENRRSFIDKKVWVHLFDSVQKGLVALATGTKSKRRRARIPRAPTIAALFLAHTSYILTKPMHHMYRPVSKFLLLDETFDFVCVPDFNLLFMSSNMNASIYREFILKLIANGIKASEDFKILQSSHIVKVLLSFYDCNFANKDTNLLVLKFVNSAVRIPKAAKQLIDSYGLMSWLDTVIADFDYFYFDSMEGVASILHNVRQSIKCNRNQYYNDRDLEAKICNLSLKLIPLVSDELPAKTFGKILRLLEHVPHNLLRSVPAEKMTHLLKNAELVLGDRVCEITNIRTIGVAYCESPADYLRRIKIVEASVNEHAVEINLDDIAALRTFVVNWLQSVKSID